MAVGTVAVLCIQEWISPSRSFAGLVASFFWGWLVGTAFKPQMVVDRKYLRIPTENRWPLWRTVPSVLLGFLAAGWVFGVFR